jgi:hypothetical protein
MFMTYPQQGSLTTTRLNNGDFVVYGKTTPDETRVIRTYGLNNSGIIDRYLYWGDSPQIDKEFITDLVSNARLKATEEM